MATSAPNAAQQIEELLAGIDQAASPQLARERAEALVRRIVAIYGDAIERILSIADAELGGDSERLFERLCQDALVESLLCLHGLHPLALEDRVAAALESVQPYVQSHRGKIELLRIEGETAYVRLGGSCNGCPSSSATLKDAVERAIFTRAPEIREVRAETEPEPALTLRVLSNGHASG